MRHILNPKRLAIAARLILLGASGGLLLSTAPALVAQDTDAAGTPPGVRPIATTPAELVPLIEPAAQQLETPAPARTASLSAIRVVRHLDIPHWLPPGEYVWNDDGAPAGETVIVVNLRARVLSVYRAGVEIGRSSLIYGGDNKPTPTGTFPILEKDADHRSNLYDAPMPHMLRLTWDGVALHGSPELADDIATRGCVGLPREFAALLFDAVDVGDNVIVWDGVTSA